MSAVVPAAIDLKASARFITGRRVRRCFADGRGATLILECGDAIVIAEDVVRLLGHALDVRDKRRVAVHVSVVDHMSAEIARVRDSLDRVGAAAPRTPPAPTWFVAISMVVLAIALGAGVELLAQWWLR